jgi:hypothetical protein
MESDHRNRRPEGPDTVTQVTEEATDLSRDLPLTGILVSMLSAAKRIELQHRLEAVRRRIAEVDLDLQRLGFDPPRTDLDGWLHLARIIEVDPSTMTAAELYEEALAWVDRIRIQEQIRQRLRRKRAGRRNLPASSTTPRESRANTGFGFVGNRDWENWGLGLDVNQGWHLFHFQRRDGSWRRHQHCELRIPSGLPGSLAQAFVSGRAERPRSPAPPALRRRQVQRIVRRAFATSPQASAAKSGSAKFNSRREISPKNSRCMNTTSGMSKPNASCMSP